MLRRNNAEKRESLQREAEKRLRRCCFSGQRVEDLKTPEEVIKAWLKVWIDAAVEDGYRTFICGGEPGVGYLGGIYCSAEAGIRRSCEADLCGALARVLGELAWNVAGPVQLPDGERGLCESVFEICS